MKISSDRATETITYIMRGNDNIERIKAGNNRSVLLV